MKFCFSAFALVASAFALTPPVKPYFWQPSSAIVLPALNLTGNISPFTGNNASFNAPWYTLNQAGHSVRITGGSLISLAEANITMPFLSATNYTQWIEFAVTSDGTVECPHSTFRAGVAITQNLTSNTAPQYYTFYTTQIGGQSYTRSLRFSPATKLVSRSLPTRARRVGSSSTTGGPRRSGIKTSMISYTCTVLEGCELGGCPLSASMVSPINLWFSGRG